MIWFWITYKGRYAIKPNQPTNEPGTLIIYLIMHH